MPNKEFVQKLGFLPKNNASGVFYKKFSAFEYVIEVDFGVKKFNFGTKIKSESGTTLNFSQEENWVVLECVSRLIEKGYKPEDITLEKIYPTGHGTSGRLDILVKKDRIAYLMIECKTRGIEYQKALKKMQKDGGQLFTYFQQDRDAEYLMLYTSELNKGEVIYENEIVKIEDHYREAGNVKDLFDRWNKLSKSNGVFDEWVNAYEFQSKALTVCSLKDIRQEDSQKVFNRFLEILRKHVVSDKPNAFNKIFNLFLCKIRDEFDDNDLSRELKFQWKDDDTQEIFQSRLNRLYREGMKIFLGKDIVDFDEEDLKNNFPEIANNEKQKKHFMEIINEIRLKKSNEFAIKEVHDQKSFEENGLVLKELVELIQEYKIRYDRRHPYLSDFFELLLTTGLKQESGQFFTPVPVARYILKSLPIKEKIQEKINSGDSNDLLPMVIDYASGSGHFLHEIMHEIQTIIDTKNFENKNSEIKNEIDGWKVGKFRWAKNYIYGIEKDYRLAKVAKVGCYLHGDGLAQVIHGDGLDNFYASKDYVNILKKNDHKQGLNNPAFDFIISNPPYSVSSFKGNMKNAFNAFGEGKHSFELYGDLTDQSSEIECLFIERTKQLLKDDGLAGIILPSSILSNTGIYTKTREILFKYFEIIGITELGSGTFMATGTSTVILFLKRRNNYEWENIKSSVEKFFQNHNDMTVCGIENIFSKYVNYVWEGITFEDYISLCNNIASKDIENHEIYKEYEKKLKANDKSDLNKKIIEKEQEKLLYFILAYNQEVILTKSGQKKEEKRFLGYEFSNRRGYEGIHSVQRGKSIDECTKMYDPENQANVAKANSYIYNAFLGKKNQTIHKSFEKNIFEINLIDMMTFDRFDLDKNISLSVKKKIKVESKWELVKLGDVTEILNGGTPDTKNQDYWDGDVNWATLVDTKNKYLYSTERKITKKGVKKSGAVLLPLNTVIFSSRATIGDMCINKVETCTNQGYKNFVCNPKKIYYEYLYYILKKYSSNIAMLATGMTYPEISKSQISDFKIPLPPKNIQEKIVDEVNELEKKEEKNKEEVENLRKSISQLLPKNNSLEKVENIATLLKRGKSPQYGNSKVQIIKSGQARGYKDFDFSDKHFASENYILDERKLEKGDILINSTGVGTAGRVTIFNLDGDYVVDSHITILRLDRTKALPDYVLQYFCDLGFKTIEAMALGQSGQIELALETIKNIKIPLPSLDEQQRIVAKIKKIENKIFKLDNELLEIKNQKEGILKKYL